MESLALGVLRGSLPSGCVTTKTSRQKLTSITIVVSPATPMPSDDHGQRNSQEEAFCRQKCISRHNWPLADHPRRAHFPKSTQVNTYVAKNVISRQKSGDISPLARGKAREGHRKPMALLAPFAHSTTHPASRVSPAYRSSSACTRCSFHPKSAAIQSATSAAIARWS
jgi:hypothetical protein